MAGISNNLGNLNLGKSVLNSTKKKAEVKEEVEQEQVIKAQGNMVKDVRVKAGDIDKDSLIAYNGIKIGKPVVAEPPAVKPNALTPEDWDKINDFIKDAMRKGVGATGRYHADDGTMYKIRVTVVNGQFDVSVQQEQ